MARTGTGVPGMEYKDYYKVLGVPKTASQPDIKKAFRKLARQHHPDAKPGDAVSEQRFKEVNEANEVLSDPDKRRKYDALGADWAAYERAGTGAGSRGSTDPFGPGGPFAGYAQGGGGVRYEFRSSDPGAEGFSDFFRMFFGSDGPAGAGAAGAPSGPSSGPRRGNRPTGGASFDDILAGMGLSGSAAGAAASAGRTVQPKPRHEATAEITLDEAFHGTTRRVEVDGKRLEITIPPGADTGTRIRLSGRGPGGGDLYVNVKQLPDPRFVRRGADLHREIPLTLAEALLGGDIQVETLKGRVLLKIPAGTQPGRTFRLTGRGMPRPKTGDHGDLLVKVKVIIPTGLSAEAAAAARAFAGLADQPDPRTSKQTENSHAT